MSKRGLFAIALALALVQSGCAAPVRPTVEELREEYPLYQPNPLSSSAWASIEDILRTADSGVLATVVDHAIVLLGNGRPGGAKAIPSMQASSKQYERYTLRIDTVLFGRNPGSEVALYLPYPASAMQPAQDIDQSVGSRFFYNLACYPQEQQQQLDTLLQCNDIQERLPVYHGGAMLYWTRQGYMLSARPLVGCDSFDLLTKAEFTKAIRALREKAKDKP